MKNFYHDIEIIVKQAIIEDVGSGDITSQLTISPKNQSLGKIVAKADGIVSGLLVVDHLLKTYTSIAYKPRFKDGQFVAKGETVLEFKGSTIEILTYERILLNFLQHLSGIATFTNQFVHKVQDFGCKILDTRKTLPGMRRLEKKAVADGNGMNHRMGLYDAILIKENHIKAAGGITAAVERIKSSKAYAGIKENPTFFLQVECENLEQVQEACDAGVDEILLDNMTPAMTAEAIQIIRKINRKISIELSGNITLQSVGNIARLRPDRISIGKITHSAPVLDLSLLLDNVLII